jgi:sugar lactone lactonase YvrE
MAFAISEENVPSTGAKTILRRTGSTSNGQLDDFVDPYAVARMDDTLVVSDLGRSTVSLFKEVEDEWHYQFDLGAPRESGTWRPLHLPMGLALDHESGWLWVADTGNNRVLGFEPPFSADAVPAIVLGQTDLHSHEPNVGDVHAASLRAPAGIDAHKGTVVVADTGNNRILLYSNPQAPGAKADAVLGQDLSFSSTLSGSGRTRFSEPGAVTIDWLGRIWVADTGNRRLLGFDPGEQQPFVVFPPVGEEVPGGLFQPVGIARGPREWVWASDPQGHRLVAFRGDRRVLIGQPDEEALHPNRLDGLGFDSPKDVALDRSVSPNRLWIADSFNNRLLGYKNTKLLTIDSHPDALLGQASFETSVEAAGRNGLNVPTALAVDSMGGLYIADRQNSRIVYYRDPWSPSPQADWLFGQPDWETTTPNTGGLGPLRLNRPEGIALDADGNLYISDTRNNRILRLPGGAQGSGEPDRVWGQAGSFVKALPNLGGSVSAAGFSLPFKITVSKAGLLAVTDVNNHRVLLFDTLSDGEDAQFVLGQGGSFESGAENLGGVSRSSLYGPEAVAFDGELLYVADTANNRVLQFTNPLSGSADEVWGQDGKFDQNVLEDARATNANFAFPSGLDVDHDGNLFVADRDHHRVLIFRR